ncbi:GSCFA domain-containing protein [Empedobacter falsenii]|uniref:GSCFA family n=1 Tax=Empedobacter falsenii TaxID=343874 RepID=A0A376GI44_9FLAO|nr:MULTISPECIES: GSCFA domain-containing protein [Empedobacter]MDM1041882.1 GSCFA domain-containing protein [Empedobacter brevis]MDM1135813.1 GSCFA domain-containing protein [Empedobacter sp. R750]STD59032.1 GSCFA family [Empedobacter falsenii]
MQFRTTFQIQSSDFKLNHQHKILTIGSCFSDEIGKRLTDLKFDGLINPFGVIFNSHSIQNLIERSIQKKYFTTADVHQNGEEFFCFDVHSSFNALTKEAVLEELNLTLDQVHDYILSCDVLMITLGTSWIYEWKTSNQVVANCHKVDAKQFEKRLLTTEENLKSLELIVSDLKNINPTIRIITTVSPVRHTKDGMIENNVSKARLLDALYQLSLQNNQVEYFPSYELVLDDLRDYRFFKEDLIHPSKQAVDYIWEKFSETYFEQSTQTIIQKINKVISAINHRPFNEESDNHQQFLVKTIALMNELEKGNQLDFSAEKELLKSKIKHVN